MTALIQWRLQWLLRLALSVAMVFAMRVVLDMGLELCHGEVRG